MNSFINALPIPHSRIILCHRHENQFLAAHLEAGLTPEGVDAKVLLLNWGTNTTLKINIPTIAAGTGFVVLLEVYVPLTTKKRMDRGYSFTPELLRMMLSEERQKFVEALGQEASWRELNRIRKTINQLNKLLDSSNERTGGSGDPSGTRHNSDDRGPGPR